MNDLLTENQEKLVEVSTKLYITASQLQMAGLDQDASSVATKAKKVLGKAIGHLVDDDRPEPGNRA